MAEIWGDLGEIYGRDRRVDPPVGLGGLGRRDGRQVELGGGRSVLDDVRDAVDAWFGLG